jgi:hypothetical protein
MGGQRSTEQRRGTMNARRRDVLYHPGTAIEHATVIQHRTGAGAGYRRQNAV